MPIRSNSGADARANRSKTFNPPEAPNINKEPKDTEFQEGQIKVGKYKDNRLGEGIEYDMLQVKVNGSVRSIPFFELVWDNETEDFAMQLKLNDRGKERTMRFIATEIV